MTIHTTSDTTCTTRRFEPRTLQTTINELYIKKKRKFCVCVLTITLVPVPYKTRIPYIMDTMTWNMTKFVSNTIITLYASTQIL